MQLILAGHPYSENIKMDKYPAAWIKTWNNGGGWRSLAFPPLLVCLPLLKHTSILPLLTTQLLLPTLLTTQLANKPQPSFGHAASLCDHLSSVFFYWLQFLLFSSSFQRRVVSKTEKSRVFSRVSGLFYANFMLPKPSRIYKIHIINFIKKTEEMVRDAFPYC